jgi:hypothetical protein
MIPRSGRTNYSIGFLLSRKDDPYCLGKPYDLPEYIDRDKVNSDSSLSRGYKKGKRQGMADIDPIEQLQQRPEHEFSDDFKKNRQGQSSGRRDNIGWQPSNHQEHAEYFINRVPHFKAPVMRSLDSQGRIIPGKGVPKRSHEVATNQATGGKSMEHQPALLNIQAKQQQGIGSFGSRTQHVGTLDSFSMGDIRQAERFLEGGKMGLDEYARKVASGEISRDANTDHASHTIGFFADDDAGSSRPWLASSNPVARFPTSSSSTKLVPGYASQRPVVPPPSSSPQSNPSAATPQQLGKDSNASGLALLQMLIDKRPGFKSQPQALHNPGQAPRQLTQQQINDLISMSKRSVPKHTSNDSFPVSRVPGKSGSGGQTLNAMKGPEQLPRNESGVPPARSQQYPGNEGKSLPAHTSKSVGSSPTPPHVASLLDQLHRQQVAQQDPARQAVSNSTPPECQQQ